MSDEQTSEEGTPVEYTEVEQTAMSSGWNPEGVEGKPNLSAEEFLGRKPMYDSIHDLKRQVKKMEEKNSTFQSHHFEVIKRLNESKEQELQAVKEKAMEELDMEAVREADKQISAHRETSQKEERTFKEEAVTQSDPAAQAFEVWVEGNDWYNTDPLMAGYANDVAGQIANSGQKLTHAELYTLVEKEVKLKYKDRFQNERRQAPSAVEGDTSRGKQGKGKSSRTMKDLDAETQTLVKSMCHGTKLTEKEYIAELEKSGYWATK